MLTVSGNTDFLTWLNCKNIWHFRQNRDCFGFADCQFIAQGKPVWQGQVPVGLKLISCRKLKELLQFMWCSSIKKIFAESRQAKRHQRDVTSRFIQLEKVGRGLLWEAYQGEGECYVSLKRGGQIRKDRSWKTQVNIGTLFLSMFTKMSLYHQGKAWLSITAYSWSPR